MSWSKTPHTENLHDQMTILVGSAIRLLCGDAGLFVVSNEAFDPQSSVEYTPYRLSESTLSLLVNVVRESVQPNSLRPLVIERVPRTLAVQFGIEERATQYTELGSLAVHDQAGLLGTLHFLRPAGNCSCFERHEEPEEGNETLFLFIAQLAAGLRSALKAQALVKEQARFATTFQHSAEGIVTVDTALRITDFNPAMERLTGWHESEVLGRFYFDVLRPKDRLGHDLGLEDSPILQAFAGQQVVDREMAIAARDGQIFNVSVTATCVRSSRGEPMSGILNVRDITREREQEEQRSTFISVISHELQTPIAIIKGYASTLARIDARFEPDAQRIRLVAIEEEADRLNKLVGNLLYASRIQANGLQMDSVSLDLAPLMQKVVRHLQVRCPDVSVIQSLPENLPPVVADRERIEEVLLNLLDNAVKYSPSQRTLSITCHATGDEVIVSIGDRGMGISLRDQERIFESFHRAGDAVARAKPGAGLGLYICQAIVEAHGGRIWVESTLRQGSTFSFSLPREEKAQLPMVIF